MITVVCQRPWSAIERRVTGSATVAGVNGDLFAASGVPSGILLRSGVLDHASQADRSGVGVAADGSLRIERVGYNGIWRGISGRRPIRLNEPPGTNGVSLFTRSWGPTTPTIAGSVEAILPSLPPTAPNTDLFATVSQIGSSNRGP